MNTYSFKYFLFDKNLKIFWFFLNLILLNIIVWFLRFNYLIIILKSFSHNYCLNLWVVISQWIIYDGLCHLLYNRHLTISYCGYSSHCRSQGVHGCFKWILKSWSHYSFLIRRIRISIWIIWCARDWSIFRRLQNINDIIHLLLFMFLLLIIHLVIMK